MPDTTKTQMWAFRLKPKHSEIIADIATYQGGLSATRVIEWALERLHADIEKDRKKNQRKSAPLS